VPATGPRRRLARYQGFFDARRILSADTAVSWPTLTGERRPAGPSEPDRATLVLAVGPDTVRRPLPVNLLLADPGRPRTGIGLDLDPPARNGDGRVVARPGPGGGPYHYVWANGVELELTGERIGAYRVRLTDDLNAWTPTGEIQLQVGAVPPPTSRVAVVRLDPQPEHIDVRVALDRRLPYRVAEDERSVSLVVYGAVSQVNFLQHGRADPYIDRARWSQPSDRVFRVDVRLHGAPWGYDTRWDGGDLVLRLNRPPPIDPGRPFRGLTIGVDPGHGGADSLTLGPTGLTEADANLGVALALRAALEREGARVVMTRTGNADVSLVERTGRGRQEDVDVWVSVHNNAFPDGVEPWPNAGTSVYYNHPRAAGLAWSVHAALLEELGLRDLGVGRADLHQARFTWAPAILTETLFMMIPEHEAFLKTEAGRRRVARAHVRGLEAWLRAQARPRPE
jgi:N-acetylmuramoyl-L-alanine amidase